MRQVRIETCTSGEPVSVSCIREFSIISVFLSYVNDTLVIKLLNVKMGKENIPI